MGSSFKSVIMLCLMSAIVTASGCKSEKSKLASVGACSQADLAKLKGDLYALEVAAGEREGDWRTRGSFELTTDASAEALVKKYTLDYSSKLPRDGFDHALAMAPGAGWQDALTNSCMAYAVTFAEDKCGFIGCGWGGVNKNHPTYIEYRSSAASSCFRAFNEFVASRKSGQNDGVNNSIVPDSNGLKIGSNSERDAYRARMRAKIPAIKAKIEACEKYLSSSEKPPLGEQPGGWFGPTSDDGGVDSTGGGGSSDNGANNGQDVTKSECKCELRNRTCNKVVDGQIVVSLTPIRNSVTGQQEICEPTGAGGFENLCNQPQLKCP
jgi:hypothetical protein